MSCCFHAMQTPPEQLRFFWFEDRTEGEDKHGPLMVEWTGMFGTRVERWRKKGTKTVRQYRVVPGPYFGGVTMEDPKTGAKTSINFFTHVFTSYAEVVDLCRSLMFEMDRLTDQTWVELSVIAVTLEVGESTVWRPDKKTPVNLTAESGPKARQRVRHDFEPEEKVVIRRVAEDKALVVRPNGDRGVLNIHRGILKEIGPAVA